MSAKTLGDELHDEQKQAAYEREMERNKSALDELFSLESWHYDKDFIEQARAELAALRATITESCALIDTLNTTIAEQARQLEQAQVVICSYRALPLGPAGYCSYSMREQHEMASDWLSVNAPAQQNHIHLADSAGGKCVICGLPAS